jgi:hypothetical protein
VDVTEPQQKAIPIYRGWEEIGKALEVSDDTAMAYAARSLDPLFVYYDHAGRPCAPVSALETWEMRNALPFYAYHQLRQAGKLPSQVDDPESNRRGRHKGERCARSGQFGSARENQGK